MNIKILSCKTCSEEVEQFLSRDLDHLRALQKAFDERIIDKPTFDEKFIEFMKSISTTCHSTILYIAERYGLLHVMEAD